MQALAHIKKLDQKLGVGACGVVYLGFDECSGGFVAVKEIPYPNTGDEAAAARVLQEVRVMQRFHSHANLVGYRGARPSPGGVQLIMEFVGGGSLERLLRLRGRLPEDVVRRYTRDILAGLRCLHEDMHVCHRDVKPGNVLLTPEGTCKLTDFGVAKVLACAAAAPDAATTPVVHNFMQTTVGTPWYMAPEVINGAGGDEDDGAEGSDGDDTGYYNPLRGVVYRGDGKRGDTASAGVGGATNLSRYERDARAQGYTTSADIWSLGVTVYEMISGQRPFGGGVTNPTAVLFAILNSAAQPPRLPDELRPTVSRELRSFLDLCFVYDKALRPSAAELLAHPWLAEPTGQRPSRQSSADQPPRAGTRGAAPGPPPRSRRQSSCSSNSAGAEFGGAAGGSPWLPVRPPRRASSPYCGSGGASSAPTPLQHSRGARGSSHGSHAPLSLPPELPSLPDRHGRGSHAPPRGEPGGFLSLDGHYVDLLARLPSPRK